MVPPPPLTQYPLPNVTVRTAPNTSNIAVRLKDPMESVSLLSTMIGSRAGASAQRAALSFRLKDNVVYKHYNYYHFYLYYYYHHQYSCHNNHYFSIFIHYCHFSKPMTSTTTTTTNTIYTSYAV